jgi:GNAT superfamily N-acetyltransferase
VTPDELLERAIADMFWLPEDARHVDRPDLGYIYCSRNQRTLNQVFRAKLRDADAGIEEVRRAHAGRDSRWCWLPTFHPPSLPDRLHCAGYRRTVEHRTAVLDVSDWIDVDGRYGVRRVLDATGLEQSYAVSSAAFGRRVHPGQDAISGELAVCQLGGRVQRYVVYDADDRPVCAGGLNIFPQLSFGFLWAGGTVPDARGRGAYRALLQARIHAARQAGLRTVGLYARIDTALPIVARLGFSVHDEMHFWDGVAPREGHG